MEAEGPLQRQPQPSELVAVPAGVAERGHAVHRRHRHDNRATVLRMSFGVKLFRGFRDPGFDRQRTDNANLNWLRSRIRNVAAQLRHRKRNTDDNQGKNNDGEKNDTSSIHSLVQCRQVDRLYR